ncbi:type II toxin-antitoxin system RelE/ParE family toxin [Cryobacterium sp. Y50]|uniref:type II toxin-antitoxin system RelE family toxin n=1 Tax=Cryobacterium sp. Y50 TaxID=2048286 RepID=UPI000CE39CE3|nr:type II toxin-antitoxin system RelE/ParE family toxin [Cryobacterium sp. Y50]
MTYSVRIAPGAQRQLHKCDPPVRRRIQAVIDLLAQDPRPPKAIQLVDGSGEWRVRTGDYRISYEIHDEQLVVLVLRLGHRRDIYES